MTEIKDMCIEDRRVIAIYEIFKIIDRLATINNIIQIGAHEEETLAITDARKAARKALGVLSKRLETMEGRGMWPINVTFDDDGNVHNYDLGTQNGWARRTINDKDGYDGLKNSVSYDAR